MRAIYSWGAAALIVLVLGLWLGTGSLIQGGNGPGKGEKPVVALIEPQGGPITNTIEKTGIQATPARAQNEPDPHLTIAQREEASVGAAAPVRSVEVKTFTAEPMPIEVDVIGQTRPKATVTAAAETTGTVASVAVTKGQAVKAGDLLCTLDPGTREAAVAQGQAALEQAQAGADKAQADYDTNKELRSKGLAAPNTERQLQVALEGAKAAVSAAQAALDNANQELGRTKIYAKSAGVVQDPVANVGQMLAAGAPCATIVQLDPIVFAGSVPEARIGYARLGMTAKVTTATGKTLEGKVTYIGSVADDATRTFPAEIELANPGNAVRAGESAEAKVDVGVAPAQLLPQSALTLDDNGTMGVRAVENSKVIFYPVTIVKDANNGMYVTGLPPKVDVIIVGQEFVKAGDTVKAVNEASMTGSAAKTAATDGAQS